MAWRAKPRAKRRKQVRRIDVRVVQAAGKLVLLHSRVAKGIARQRPFRLITPLGGRNFYKPSRRVPRGSCARDRLTNMDQTA
jgi:hypothetical protein